MSKLPVYGTVVTILLVSMVITSYLFPDYVAFFSDRNPYSRSMADAKTGNIEQVGLLNNEQYLANREQNLADFEKDLTDREKDLTNREKDLDTRENNFARREYEDINKPAINEVGNSASASKPKMSQFPATEQEENPTLLNYSMSTRKMGQLGNNMFQYAVLLGVARLTGHRPILPNTFGHMQLLFNLSIPMSEDIVAIPRNYVKVDEPPDEQKNALKTIQNVTKLTDRDVMLSGFFQSCQYFDNVPGDL